MGNKVSYVYISRVVDPENNLIDSALQSQTMSKAREMLGLENPKERPGVLLASEGVKPFYPVVFIPGIVSTTLEVWKGKPCATQ